MARLPSSDLGRRRFDSCHPDVTAQKLPEEIPYNNDGDVLYQVYHHSEKYGGLIWAKNEPFKCRLKLVSYQKTASSIAFVWERPDGRQISMLASEFQKLFPLNLTDGWTDEHTWVVRRHPGNVYALTRIDQ